MEKEKDEDQIFDTLIVSQLQQPSLETKIWVKMQISNIIYEQKMHPIGRDSQFQTCSSHQAEASGNPFHCPKTSYSRFSKTCI